MIRSQTTHEQRKELENFRRQASSKNSEKALMVLMSAEGQSVADISSTLRRNPHTVRDWLKRYKAKGLPGLSRRYSPGRPSVKRALVKKRIKEIISKPPESYGYMDSVWTVPLIKYDISKNLNISASNDTVIRALKNMGYSFKRPSKSPPAKAPTRKEKAMAVKKMISKIEEIIKNKDSEIYALDESHFSTEPYLVQGWFLKRWPPQDSNQQQERKSHILWMLEFKDTKILLEKVE